jgi:hypothetical protein
VNLAFLSLLRVLLQWLFSLTLPRVRHSKLCWMVRTFGDRKNHWRLTLDLIYRGRPSESRDHPHPRCLLVLDHLLELVAL